MLIIRKAITGDIKAITEIYNEAVVKTTATFVTQPKTLQEQQTWFTDHQLRYPLIVAQQDNQIVGWASLNKWSDLYAYNDTAEVSVYIHNGFQRKGIGRQLLKKTIQEGRTNRFHTIIARITSDNQASINLLKSEGFCEIGLMREVGRKFDKLLDVCLMQIIFDAPPTIIPSFLKQS
jgi:Sortase and related acyltransferases